MAGSTESSRVKQQKNCLLEEHDRGDEHEVKEVGSKPQVDSKKMDDETYVYRSAKKEKEKKPKGKKGRRSLATCHQSSLLSISTSLNNNCCLFCGAFMRYVRSVFGFLSCLATCRIRQGRELERLFCELLDAAGDACIDLMCFIRKILHCCVGLSKK